MLIDVHSHTDKNYKDIKVIVNSTTPQTIKKVIKSGIERLRRGTLTCLPSAAFLLFFRFLAGYAKPGVRNRRKSFGINCFATLFALAVGLISHTPQSLVDMIEQPARFRSEIKGFFPLHGIRTLVGHMV